jgi:hypothetical protein
MEAIMKIRSIQVKDLFGTYDYKGSLICYQDPWG